MKWWNRWRYLIIWAVAGIVYLSAIDDWQVYAKPLEQVKIWYEDMKRDFRQAGNFREGLWQTVSGPEGITVSGAQGVSVPGAAGDVSVGSDGTTAPGAEGSGSVGADGTTAPGAAGDVPVGADGATAPGAEGSGSVGADGTTAPGAAGSVSGGADTLSPGGEGMPETSPETSGSVPGAVYHTVEDDYFADAVFIGDSRTVGMFEYGGLEETADFYASMGLTVYKLFESEIVAVEGQRKKISVEQALSQKSYAKIYLMIGINEMGTGTVESFAAAYKEAVDHLLELQPDAILYIQGIIKVTTERSGQGDYINNEGIEARNEALSLLADNERIFYLDVNPEICDETGGMEPSYTFDGVHLKAQYIDLWKTFLKEHAVVYESN